MSEVLFDFGRITLAVVCGGVSVAMFRLAWQILRFRPTQTDIAAEHRRRALASIFRNMAKGPQP